MPAGSSLEFGVATSIEDPDKAMEPVWAELNRLGIIPGGIDVVTAEPSQPPSPEVSESDASVPSEFTEASPGGAESVDLDVPKHEDGCTTYETRSL